MSFLYCCFFFHVWLWFAFCLSWDNCINSVAVLTFAFSLSPSLTLAFFVLIATFRPELWTIRTVAVLFITVADNWISWRRPVLPLRLQSSWSPPMKMASHRYIWPSSRAICRWWRCCWRTRPTSMHWTMRAIRSFIGQQVQCKHILDDLCSVIIQSVAAQMAHWPELDFHFVFFDLLNFSFCCCVGLLLPVCAEVEALRALLAAGADISNTDINGGSPVINLIMKLAHRRRWVQHTHKVHTTHRHARRALFRPHRCVCVSV